MLLVGMVRALLLKEELHDLAPGVIGPEPFCDMPLSQRGRVSAKKRSRKQSQK
jgi:hypothetical protein